MIYSTIPENYLLKNPHDEIIENLANLEVLSKITKDFRDNVSERLYTTHNDRQLVEYGKLINDLTTHLNSLNNNIVNFTTVFSDVANISIDQITTLAADKCPNIAEQYDGKGITPSQLTENSKNICKNIIKILSPMMKDTEFDFKYQILQGSCTDY